MLCKFSLTITIWPRINKQNKFNQLIKKVIKFHFIIKKIHEMNKFTRSEVAQVGMIFQLRACMVTPYTIVSPHQVKRKK